MCGRYALFALPPKMIEELLGYVPMDEHGLILPRWNIAPTQRAPVVRVAADGRRRLDELRWGLVPAWADDLRFGSRCINARLDTAAIKPAFRAAWRSRRCLVPATGFYEWTATKPKRAFVFRRETEEPLVFAGLWESWADKGTGEVFETYTIVTRDPYEAVRPVHDRSPLALPRDLWTPWLAGEIRDAAALANVAGAEGLVAREVDAAIGSASYGERPAETGPPG